MHLAMRPTPCTTGQVHLLVYIYIYFSKTIFLCKHCNISTVTNTGVHICIVYVAYML